MQLTGPDAWGVPPDRADAIDLLRCAYDWGVRLFDSAWYYGPGVTHDLLVEALSPFPDDIIIVTKAGNSRGPGRSWIPALTPNDLRAACERDLSWLKVEVLPLALLRWQPRQGDESAFLDALATMLELRDAGKIIGVGLSNVTLRHLTTALALAPIAAVSNSFSLIARRETRVLDVCNREAIAFLPYYPLLGGDVLRRPALQAMARRHGITPAQLALIWVKSRGPSVIPIPGTQDKRHLRDNIEACRIEVTRDELSLLSDLVEPGLAS